MKLTTALTVLFVGLKLAHVIAWSWWLALVPICGGFFLHCLFLTLYVTYLSKYGTDQEKIALKLKGYI
jgi:hypothetical protein